MAETEDLLLWENADPRSTSMWEFLELVNHKYHQKINTYQELHKWSIENISDFWGEVWRFTGIRGTPFKHAVDSKAPMFPRPKFFQGSTLNFAENLLYPKSDPDPKSTAIISATESTTKEITWEELREQVRECAKAMSARGVRPHDRVAGFLGNHSDTVVVMLAATSLGAVWTGVSADTGVALVVEKLSQIKPVLLFADNAVTSHGKVHESTTKTIEIAKLLSTLKTVVIFPTVDGLPIDTTKIKTANGETLTYAKFLENTPEQGKYLEFEKFPPEHPAYILYSSGTTGKPKCIVHSAAGTLIQHKKEHVLHCDIHPGDRLFYVTTCSWMMWHWLVAGLGSGATIVMFQGNPFKPEGNMSMPKLIERLKITQFGTSAKYLSILEQGNCQPLKAGVDLSSLRAIYSTGSPLAPSTFKYVYDAFPKTINLGSITGGTDIISLFGAPSPISPVYQGEIQVRGLGMDISAVDNDGKVIPDGQAGDLVCLKPFPCQPVGFWAADDDVHGHIEEYTGHKGFVIKYNNKRYFGSYFERVPGAWHHGDFVRFNPKTGGLVMLGRSDGILNRSGVRFGSSEIYNLLLREFPNEVEDALCIGRRKKEDTDEAVVLFVKIKKGVACDDRFKTSIKNKIGHFLSRSHIPDVIDECFEIPKTSNDKKIEIVVKQLISGENVKTSASVANPECLEWYKEWAKTH